MNFTVYILYSDSCGKFYSGQTQDLNNRLHEHNSGETPSIKHGRPWRLVFSIIVATRSEAIILESKIKKRGAKRFLIDNNIKWLEYGA
jgi:putative endonuclease